MAYISVMYWGEGSLELPKKIRTKSLCSIFVCPLHLVPVKIRQVGRYWFLAIEAPPGENAEDTENADFALLRRGRI